MTQEIEEATKQLIFKRINSPGVEIDDIAKDFNLDREKVLEILADEYLKYDLNSGRRLCCKY